MEFYQDIMNPNPRDSSLKNSSLGAEINSGQSHKFNKAILRESDIRGIVGENLDATDAYYIGRSFGSVVRLCGGETVAVGYDGRLSSPGLAHALAEGLKHCGVQVLDIGLGPSPMLYYAVHSLNLHGGIMVTGSHNPAEYNGFKLMLAQSSFYGAEIQKLEKIALAGEFVTGEGRVDPTVILPEYINRLLQDAIDFSGLRVAWDPGNGAAAEIICKLTKKLKGTHFLINERIDGTFPAHHPDPTVPENLAQLIETVRLNNCDLGIAFDGDGDRIGVVDSSGRILWGDQLMQLFAKEVLMESPGAPIIADVKASQSLFDEISNMGGTPIMWKTGHSLIKSKMAETKAPLAGEMSGHIFFADKYYGFDDAVYAAIRLLSILAKSSTSATEVFNSLPQAVNTPEIRFDCPEDEKKAIVDRVRRSLKKSNANMICIDGVRVETENGWWLLRASNTQPVLVARCESTNQTGLKILFAELTTHLKQNGYQGTIPHF
ncbi:MAG: phosphomannomutase/phosphoglucomutase [Sneathiella sp.]|uniref:phosphoglucomutase/phosphomannomutase PgmG n=1 Tax=Sneathiella sp. TaxID=1964365 RepID=UPI003003149E